ncbi:MAG: glutathione peroxidase [Zetaproteobacteria bacterium]|nr:glutathione peroxidase [Zetaproteobacteria bacterium]
MQSATIYEYKMPLLDGKVWDMAELKGKVVLIVNTASKCGFTPQLEGLQALYDKYQQRGLVVLAFPCNQFGQQEPGQSEEIRDFCLLNYGVTFPVFAKGDVNGEDAWPLFAYLKEALPGLLGSTAIKWNFTKFLVGADGVPVKRYAPQAEPASLEQDVEALL